VFSHICVVVKRRYIFIVKRRRMQTAFDDNVDDRSRGEDGTEVSKGTREAEVEERDIRYKERRREPRWRDPSEKRSRLQSSSDDAIACSCIRRHLIALALSCQIHYISLSSGSLSRSRRLFPPLCSRSTRCKFSIETRKVTHFEIPRRIPKRWSNE